MKNYVIMYDEMAAVFLLLFFNLIGNLLATHCDKELDYHDNYGYGIDITCEDLSNENKKMLKNVSVSNEIVLNIINSNLTEVKSDLFTNVKKIKYLSITNSTFSFDPKEEVFANFEKLEYLTVENTKFNYLDSNLFNNLDDLKKLTLKNCSLSNIKNKTFSNLNNLETLKLSYNHFKSLFDISFCDLQNLKFLDMDHNEIDKIENHFVVCFVSEDETEFTLNGRQHGISHSKGSLYHQAKSDFNLVELDLSFNNISKIENFYWATILKYIDLSNNKLKHISEGTFTMLQDLETLNLKNNLLEKIGKKLFNNLNNLIHLNLENNSLSCIHLQNLSKLEVINLSKNNLNSTSLTYLRNLKSLQKLFLADNNLEILPKLFFGNFSSLEIIDLSNNKLKLTSTSFKNAINLSKLFIKNNSLETIFYTTFNKLSNLDTLDLSVNKIGPVLDSRIFIGLNKLETLNISFNLLEYLNYDLLKPLHNLQVLDISGNRLQQFQINIVSLLPSLKVINIRSNLLSCSVLSTIITFLKSKDISFTINEEFEFERQNVDGIYCEEIASSLLRQEANGFNWVSIIGILLLVVIFSVCFSFVFYKCLLYSKRRSYRNDEFELL